MRYLLLLLLAAPLSAQRPIDYGLATVSSSLLVLDWSQTREVARHPGSYSETNFLLGRHPSPAVVDRYFAIVGLANLAALKLPAIPRRLWYGSVIVLESVCLYHGHVLGVRMRF